MWRGLRIDDVGRSRGTGLGRVEGSIEWFAGAVPSGRDVKTLGVWQSTAGRCPVVARQGSVVCSEAEEGQLRAVSAVWIGVVCPEVCEQARRSNPG